MSFDDNDDGGASVADKPAILGDEDSPTTPANLSGTAGGGDDQDGEDGDDDDDTQADFLRFAASLPGGGGKTGSKGAGAGGKKSATAGSKKTLRRGEKDFESHGTRAQVNVLEDSREAMGHVLGYTRTHKAPGHKDYLRGWYYPEWWAEAGDVQKRMTSAAAAAGAKTNTATAETLAGSAGDGDTSGMFSTDRVVVLESDGGSTLFRSTGRVFRGLDRDTPARSKMWLLPEEALYLVERGDLDLWWPYRPLSDMFPPESLLTVPTAAGSGEQQQQQQSIPDVLGAGTADYELGMPLSLQAAYSLFIGADGERGKVSLEKYQVYTNLRRTGYTVLRATPIPLPPKPPPMTHTSVWQWLFSLVPSPSSSPERPHLSDGPLVKPGLYRSYRPIFEQQVIIQRHKPVYETAEFFSGSSTLAPHPSPPPQDPFRIHYHVWKASGTFTKARPPPPDFQIAVADTRTSSVPTLEELTALLGSTPWRPPPTPPQSSARNGNGSGGGMNVGHMYKRLKHGWRNAIVAVVDRGMISYVRLTEMAFGEELLYAGFDDKNKRGGGKRGGRGGEVEAAVGAVGEGEVVSEAVDIIGRELCVAGGNIINERGMMADGILGVVGAVGKALKLQVVGHERRGTMVSSEVKFYHHEFE
ncbi:tRNA-splicing endonuclease subunit Sen54 [Microdochium nivale]|nr:tRNA-splicing endonuclease subunit Sen54 [Microdochium nivale]